MTGASVAYYAQQRDDWIIGGILFALLFRQFAYSVISLSRDQD